MALVAAIAAAIVRDRRAPEAVVALGGAALLLVVGVLGWGEARDEAGDLAPTLVVLAALLVLGDGCERAGLFDALAARLARGARGSASRLLGLVVLAAAGGDRGARARRDRRAAHAGGVRGGGEGAARRAARGLRVRAPRELGVAAAADLEPHEPAGVPGASELSFARFAALMALPWVVAIAIEWGALRWAFRRELRRARAGRRREPRCRRRVPRRAPLVVLALTLAGFVIAGPLGLDAAWPAAARRAADGRGHARVVARDRPAAARASCSASG